MYEVEYKNDKFVHGIVRYPTGALYEGAVKNYKQEGFGTLHYPLGGMYEGEWKDDKRSGFGTLKDPWGEYIGQWRNDEPVWKPLNNRLL